MLFHFAAYSKYMGAYSHLLQYVSVRAMGALLSSWVLFVVCGELFIKACSLFFRSPSRQWTPDNHRSKNNTPTMGGIFIVTVIIVSTLLWCNLTSPLVWLAIACLLGFGAIGAWDDWSKISLKKGIPASQKFIAQLIVAFTISMGWLYLAYPSTELYFPFFKNFHPEMGFLFIPWVMFVLIGTSNAVNLTDGLDGLATGSLLPTFGVFSLISYAAGHYVIAQYLSIPFAGTAEVAVIGAAVIGALLGFLWYNMYPAQIFMGDVGSLPLGAVLAFIALVSKQELLLPLAGGLFVVETLSVILQVLYFRYFKKRLFKMAPIHHHFELLGWHESKVTIRFCIISFILAVVTVATLKVR